MKTSRIIIKTFSVKFSIALTLSVFVFFSCKDSSDLTFTAIVYNTSGYDARVFIGDTLVPLYIVLDQDSLVLEGVCGERITEGCLLDDRGTPSGSSIVFDTLRILRRDVSECVGSFSERKCFSSDPRRSSASSISWTSEERGGRQHYIFTITEEDFQEAVPL